MKYIVPGTPVPLKRHRHNHNHVYDPQVKIKEDFQYLLKAQHGNSPLLKSPLYLSMKFYFPLPKKLNKNRSYIYHYCKPDLSNLIKFIEDVCNNIIYKDDSQITHIEAFKFYDHNPRTEFIILPLFTKELDGLSPKSSKK